MTAKPTRKQTDAEMGKLVRQYLKLFHAPFRRGYSYDNSVYDEMNRFVVSCQSSAAASVYIRLANRMAREDRKEKRR